MLERITRHIERLPALQSAKRVRIHADFTLFTLRGGFGALDGDAQGFVRGPVRELVVARTVADDAAAGADVEVFGGRAGGAAAAAGGEAVGALVVEERGAVGGWLLMLFFIFFSFF
jgi:hypothetical protein